MKTWLDSYKELMNRTRWLSLTGTTLVLLLVSWKAVELAEFVQAVSPINSEQLSLIFWDFAYAVPLFGALIWRIVILGSHQIPGYGKQLLSSVLLVFVFGAFIVFYVYKSLPDCIYSKDGNCYALYDATRSFSSANLGAVTYILVSGVRFLFTALIAFVIARFSLK